jgi:hypothetical protein
MLFLIDTDDPAAVIENDKAVAGRALIECAHVFGHALISFLSH